MRVCIPGSGLMGSKGIAAELIRFMARGRREFHRKHRGPRTRANSRFYERPGRSLKPAPRSYDSIFGASSPSVTLLLLLRFEGFLRFLEALHHGLIVRSVRSI